jgi:hypothetical protein
VTLIIGIGAKARQGKDTAAEAIVEFYTRQRDRAILHLIKTKIPTVKQFRFAEALYEECRTIHGMTDKDSPLLQKIGAARRAEDPDYWTKQVFDRIGDTGIAVISDVRYQNEALTIRNRGGFLVNVARVNFNGTPYIAEDRPSDHQSETELDNFAWDYYIKARSGDSVLVCEQAITIIEYIRGLNV